MKEERITFNIILKYNTFFWGAWLIFYSLIFYRNIPNMPYYGAVLSSILITTPLFSLSLIIWPIVRRFQHIRISRFSLIILHFLLANIYTIIWLCVYYGILILLFGDQLYTFFNVPETIGWQYPSGITFYLMVSGAYYSIIYYRETKLKEINESKLQLILKEAQFKALKNQLNPHFLFNALNSINALIKSDPDSARSMLVKLSDLLRMSLNQHDNAFIPIKQELAFANAFLDIEKIRLTDRFEFRESISENILDITVPSMIIQPLLENALKHGIVPSTKRGFLELVIEKSEESLLIKVINSLDDQIKRKSTYEKNDNGVGLKNLTNRLKMLYNTDFKFNSGKTNDNLFKVELRIPLNDLSGA